MKKYILQLVDVVICPFVFVGSFLFLFIRKAGIRRMKVSREIFNKLGVYPIVDHYYEPLFNPARVNKALLDTKRELPAIDLNVEEQLAVLERFAYNEELLALPVNKRNDAEFYYLNENYKFGDAEYLYNMARLHKPGRIIEIGSGYTTLFLEKALLQNKREDPGYVCDHICIEPYEMPWLDDLNVTIMREKVEGLDCDIFRRLNKNDILLIDSSHIIRPQGDVLHEYLRILPILRSGVFVHIHDIFTPKDYPAPWLVDNVLLWNEQYLLEAFLSFNDQYKIVGALNFLKHNHFDELAAKCPLLRKHPGSEPGAFWMRKV